MTRLGFAIGLPVLPAVGIPARMLDDAGILWLVVGVFAVGLGLLLVHRRRQAAHGTRGWGSADCLPASAPAPSRDVCMAEAMVLAVAGLTVFVMTATNRRTGGLMLALNELQPSFAAANTVLCACAGLGVLAALAVTLSGRAWAGTLIMAAALAAYGWTVNGLEPNGTWQPAARYTIVLEGGIAGADLWVNGVHLGKTPVETTLDEFDAKIPYWPEPPKGYKDGTDEAHLPRYYPYTKMNVAEQRWFELVPPYSQCAGDRQKLKGDPPKYYARVRLSGEWGCGRTRGSMCFSNGQTRFCHTTLRARFPKCEERLASLLDIARLGDYRVRPDWFRAIETYGKPGWAMLREAAIQEPQLDAILDAWATWRYGLAEAIGRDSAWEVFQRICDEADANRCYSTASVSGRAVELLVPTLSAARLVDCAEAAIKRYRQRPVSLCHGEQYGRMQFSVSPLYVFDGGHIPPHAIALAHAVWALDTRLSSDDPSKPNVVEQRVTPALICWQPFPQALTAACALGGPDIDRFLLRSDWRADPGHHCGRVPGVSVPLSVRDEVNPWLYLLANLSTQAGKQFRKRHEHLLMAMAARLQACAYDRRYLLDFLFLDLDRGHVSLARKYWPRYRALAARAGQFSLTYQWRYLVRAEPVSTVEMYVEAWRSLQYDDDSRHSACDEFKPLPPEKRDAVVDALVREVQENPTPPTGWRKSVSAWQDRMVRSLRAEKLVGDEPVARSRLAYLRANPSDDKRSSMALWLQHSRPDHPLVAMLASEADPALCLLAMGALKAHPTPHNREILQQLLADPHSSVKAAAEDVEAGLEALAATDPSRLALMDEEHRP